MATKLPLRFVLVVSISISEVDGSMMTPCFNLCTHGLFALHLHTLN